MNKDHVCKSEAALEMRKRKANHLKSARSLAKRFYPHMKIKLRNAKVRKMAYDDEQASSVPRTTGQHVRVQDLFKK